jgi:hypothetical protein
MKTVSIFLLLSVSACADESGEPVEFAELPPALAGGICENAFRCCTDAEIAEQFGAVLPTSDADSCSTSLSLVLGLGIAGARASIERGRIRYDAERAGACLARLENTACDASVAVDAEAFGQCDGMFVPLVAERGACASDEECITGFCDVGTGTEGLCAPLPQRGDACSTTCAEGSHCDLGTCAPLEPAGSACFSGTECESGRCVSDACAPDMATCDGR